ncbi:MAG: polyhydroxyalkanoate synthesis repressor PhaR [Gammaproteobacteria bacterium]
MPDQRIIKKYPNRRLYDTVISKYITLEEVRKLVVDGVGFCVKDVKTGKDLTRSILMQIIAEQEHGNEPIFSIQTLSRIICAYGDTQQHLLSDYLQKNLEDFARKQQTSRAEIEKTGFPEIPANDTSLSGPNRGRWTPIRENMTGAAAGIQTCDPDAETGN